eukprot:gnl/Chilomastix_cuspidata/3100.p1 GENE.gnl/Chilomastix_cuspidata/3100~~gnl/Chilomastix_cuspidata/3100.p1  ORF type:complete len:203 (+),score=70.26 gnl/Chilomastix_cuspidata/3100:124-732(+)
MPHVVVARYCGCHLLSWFRFVSEMADREELGPKSYVKYLVDAFCDNLAATAEAFRLFVEKNFPKIESQKMTDTFSSIVLETMTKNHRTLEAYLSKYVFDALEQKDMPESPEKSVAAALAELRAADEKIARAFSDVSEVLQGIRVAQAERSFLEARETLISGVGETSQVVRADAEGAASIAERLETQRKAIEALTAQLLATAE